MHTIIWHLRVEHGRARKLAPHPEAIVSHTGTESAWTRRVCRMGLVHIRDTDQDDEFNMRGGHKPRNPTSNLAAQSLAIDSRHTKSNARHFRREAPGQTAFTVPMNSDGGVSMHLHGRIELQCCWIPNLMVLKMCHHAKLRCASNVSTPLPIS